MPLVEYLCDTHGKYEQIHDINEEYNSHCPICGNKGKRVWSPFSFSIDFKPGYDPGIGKYIDTKSERDSELKRRGLRRDL